VLLSIEAHNRVKIGQPVGAQPPDTGFRFRMSRLLVQDWCISNCSFGVVPFYNATSTDVKEEGRLEGGLRAPDNPLLATPINACAF